MVLSGPSQIPLPTSHPVGAVSRSLPPVSFRFMVAPMGVFSGISDYGLRVKFSLFAVVTVPSWTGVISMEPFSVSSYFGFLLRDPVSRQFSGALRVPIPRPIKLWMGFAPLLFSMGASPGVPVAFSVRMRPSMRAIFIFSSLGRPIDGIGGTGVTGGIFFVFPPY